MTRPTLYRTRARSGYRGVYFQVILGFLLHFIVDCATIFHSQEFAA